MTCDPIYTVWCEASGCGEWTGEEHSRAAARQVARSRGWVRRDGRDFCPDHQPVADPS